MRRSQALGGLALLVCGVAASGCPLPTGASTSTIEIINHGVTYTRTVGINQTYAWDAAKLGDVADLFKIENSTVLRLTSKRPRELFAFSFSQPEDLTPGSPPPWWPVPLTANVIQWASLGTAETYTTTSRTVRMPVMSARLIDHGGCFSPTPFVAGPDAAFRTIADKIAESLAACNDVSEKDVALQASFLVPAQSNQLDVTVNDDGFTFRGNYKGCIRWLGIKFCGDFTLGKTFAVRTVDGFPAFEAIGSVELGGLPSDARQSAARTLGNEPFGGCMPDGGDACNSDPDFSKPCLHDWECSSKKCLAVPFGPQLREGLMTAIIRKGEDAGKEGTQLPVPGNCVLGAEGDALCEKVGPDQAATGYFAKTGDAAGRDFLKANLHPKSFVCRPPIGNKNSTDDGRCFYRPWFQRFNVLPDKLEAVWFNGDDVVGKSPNTADYLLVKTIQPDAVPAFCGADYLSKGPAAIPAFAR